MIRILKIFVVVFLFFSAGVKGWAQKVVAEYEQIRDVNRDGNPSRCDCDYHKKSLVFKKDSSFVFEEVRGRISPEKQFGYRGTWKVENDSVLVLHVTHSSSFITGKDERVNEYDNQYMIDSHGQIYTGYGDIAEKWEGSGIVRTSQQTRKKQ